MSGLQLAGLAVARVGLLTANGRIGNGREANVSCVHVVRRHFERQVIRYGNRWFVRPADGLLTLEDVLLMRGMLAGQGLTDDVRQVGDVRGRCARC